MADRPPRPSAAFDPRIQFWTSRGFAVADVNYAGSSGYGRAYRDALEREWGVLDVADCVAVAESLAAEGRVDRTRLAITGGSAGGFTTLCALTFHDVFRAGASHYGIGDLEALVATPTSSSRTTRTGSSASGRRSGHVMSSARRSTPRTGSAAR
jgi:dipeptidyl aminopeptidase/acylaminoacyl peptidase